jgi:hypothetical protein
MLAVLRAFGASTTRWHPSPTLFAFPISLHQLSVVSDSLSNDSLTSKTSNHACFRDTPLCHRSRRRSVFTLPGFEEETAKRYTERRLIGYSPKQMFDVVADVQRYSEFVPWCQRSSVVRRLSDTVIEAELEVGFQIFVER